jgi:hypothetical protein
VGAGSVTLAMAAGVVAVVGPEGEPAPAPGQTSPAGGGDAVRVTHAPPAPPQVDLAAEVRRAVDPDVPAEERVQALRLASRHAPDAGWTKAALAALRDDDPFASQVRSMVLSALERHSTAPTARNLALAAARPDRPREERLVALSVIGAMLRRSPDRGWARPTLDELTSDPDPQVRASALAALDDGS